MNIFGQQEKIETLKNEYNSLLKKKYMLLPHKSNFLIPFSYNLKPNESTYDTLKDSSELRSRGLYNKKLEAEFQVSFMVLTSREIFSTDFDLFVAYTQQSWWQVYNSDWSRPFRETNYTPEIFARKVFDTPKTFLNGKAIYYDIGLVHQSNGQTQELSRSWNRIFFRSVLSYGNTYIKPTLWYRLPEASDKDQNKDIYKYLGYGELEIDHVWSKSRMRLRIIPGTKYQGAELSYSYPWHQGVRYFFKVGYGYGLNLIDYRHETQRIGVGVILSDLLSFSETN